MAVTPKDASPPPFVPADAVKFERWRIDLQKGWTAIKATLTEIFPTFGGSLKLILDMARESVQSTLRSSNAGTVRFTA